MPAPTIRPADHFSPEADAKVLLHSLEDETSSHADRITSLLCSRSNAQRQDIAKTFYAISGKDIIKELDKIGDVADILLALMKLPEVLDVETLRKAIRNIDHKEQVIIDVLTTNSRERLEKIKRLYKKTFGTDLADEIRKTGDRQLLVDLSAKSVDDSDEVDAYAAYEDALAIVKEKEDRCAGKDCNLRKALLTRSWPHLRIMFAEYERLTSTSVESLAEVINWDQDRGLWLPAGLKFFEIRKPWLPDIIAPIRDPICHYADRIHGCMFDHEPSHQELAYIVISRSELDLGDILHMYAHRYGQTAQASIDKRFGCFGKALLKLMECD